MKTRALVISAMVLFTVLSVFTTSASAYCNSGSVNVVVTNPDGTTGGAYPYSSTPMTETTVSYTAIDATLLSSYDTLVFWRFCNPQGALTASQKTDINNWIYSGGKLIIWDTECAVWMSPYIEPSYTWLPYSFITNNPGAMGSRRCPLTILEENTLSTTTAGPYYIDTSAVCSGTDAVGDSNILTSYSSEWCQDMEALNYNDEIGPVHVYARYGSGLIIYCGLDANHIRYSTTGGTHLRQILLNELAQPWGDEDCGLPCLEPIQPGELEVIKTGDKTSMNVDDTVTFTITVENIGTSTINSIELRDILPPELTTSDPLIYSIGTLDPTDPPAVVTITAKAVSIGNAQNLAKATGTDEGGNTVGDDDTFTVRIGPSIPEFASIAIPVLSIFGLLFFLNHRKRREG